MIIENPDSLRIWLTNHLKPLCDADPAALAKYVLALLKKDKTEVELRHGMIEQLDVFLQQDTIKFVDKLLVIIETKEYFGTKEEVEEEMDPSVVLPDATKLESSSSEADSSTSANSSTLRLSPGSSLNISLNASSGSGGEPDRSGLNMSSSSAESVKSAPGNTILHCSPVSSTPFTCSPDEDISPIKSEARLRSSSSSRKDSTRGTINNRERDSRFRRNKSRSPRRSRTRSRERGRRSWSPKEQQRGGRYRGGNRRSPMRRYDNRDTWDRRRSPVARNRSPSPRSRSPHRYNRRGYDNNQRGRSRSRSPTDRQRSRSPTRHVAPRLLEGMDSQTVGAAPSAQNVVKPVEQTGQADAAPNGDFKAPVPAGNRCKDFDERGLCMRGDLCPYDHGQNPVVLQDVGGGVGGLKRTVQVTEVNLPGGLPFSNMSGPPVDFRIIRPNTPMLGMDPMMEGAPPVGMPWGIPPPQQFQHRGGGPRGRGGMFLRHPHPHPHPHPVFPMQGPPQRELISVPVMGGGQPVQIMPEMEQAPGSGFPQMHPMGMYQSRGMPGGRGRGRGRGGFDHTRLGAKPRAYNNSSLEVKRIPKELNNISDLNSHFVQFGKIVNIQINFDNDPEAALITFAAPNEAYNAYKSTEAVLNNRFIRVFWHNKEKENEDEFTEPMPQRPSIRDRLGVHEPTDVKMELETERILVSGNNLTKTVYNANFVKKEVSEEKVQAVEAIKKSQEQLAAQEQMKRIREEKKKEQLQLLSDLQKKKQSMLAEQIGQQKKLIHKLETSKTMKPEEKEQLMSLIKSLQESIETIKKGLDESVNVYPSSPQKPGPQVSGPPKTRDEFWDTTISQLKITGVSQPHPPPYPMQTSKYWCAANYNPPTPKRILPWNPPTPVNLGPGPSGTFTDTRYKLDSIKVPVDRQIMESQYKMKSPNISDEQATFSTIITGTKYTMDAKNIPGGPKYLDPDASGFYIFNEPETNPWMREAEGLESYEPPEDQKRYEPAEVEPYDPEAPSTSYSQISYPMLSPHQSPSIPTQKDILDAEMDLYNTELEGGDTLALKRKVLELRARAKAAGIYGRGGRGGYRGVLSRGGGFGRGRGGRGRGGAPAHAPRTGDSYKWLKQNKEKNPQGEFPSNGLASQAEFEAEIEVGEADEGDMYETSVDEFFDEAEYEEEEENEDEERTWRKTYNK